MRYPDTLTEDDLELGFRLLEVDGLGGVSRPEPAVAIVRVLSPSSILVKSTEHLYSYRIFGINKSFRGHPRIKRLPEWTAVANPINNPGLFVQEYEVGISAPPVFDIEEHPFQFREIQA